MDDHRRTLLLLKKKLLLLKKKKLLLELVQDERKERRWWVHPNWRNRKEQGYFHTLLEARREHDEEYFQNFTRMHPTVFDKLVGLVHARLKKYPPSREPISPEHRLAITLRFLATGDSLISMAYGFRIARSTAHQIIKETCTVLWDVLQPLYLPQPTVESWKASSIEFRNQWQFPQCVGAVDGRHVVLQQPAKSGSLNNDHKGTKSIVLMTIVDANLKYVAVDIGTDVPNSNGEVFKSCAMGKALENQSLCLPGLSQLPESNFTVPHVLLGDEAFQLRPVLLRPFKAAVLSSQSRVFNYRLSRARCCSENAFGIMGARWQIFQKPMMLAPENVTRVTKAAVVLHNYLLSEEALVQPSEKVYCPSGFADYADSLGNMLLGAWRDQAPSSALQNIVPTASRNFSFDAASVRNKFSDYFWSDKGQVSWQWDVPGVDRE